MSHEALRLVAATRGLTPPQKLTAYQLADFHNEHTGQCNPCPERVAEMTGLSPSQVHSAISALTQRGILHRRGGSVRFAGLDVAETPGPVPSNWWPSEATISELVRDHPCHFFSIEDAVHDFIAYAHKRDLTFRPDTIDRAFKRATSAILRARRPGEVVINRETPGGRPASVFDLLAGAD